MVDCPAARAPSSSADEVLLTTRGTDAEWRQLATSLAAAFLASGEVSAEHEAGTLLRRANAQRLCRELRGYERWHEGCYTRTTLVEGDGYVVLLLCWAPGAISPVHAHSDANTGVQSNCFMRILDGELVETRYPPIARLGDDRVDAHLAQATALGEGGYAYINDLQGLHKVGNASSSAGAVSLHVYAPGWSTVRVYDEEVPTDASGAVLDCDGWGDF